MSQQRSDAHATSDRVDVIAKDTTENVGDNSGNRPGAQRQAVTHELRPVPLQQATADSDGTPPAADPPAPAPGAELVERLEKLERQNKRLRLGLVLTALLVAALSYFEFLPEGVIVQKTLLESQEVKLLDKSGNARLFLRMYSRVPVLQIMDGNGKPRMSLGLRFDDTPFIDLSDKSGNTRATFEMTETDEPTLRLFDANGETTFQIN